MELRMITNLETALPAEIAFNFDELKADLTERLDHYNSLIVTEDTIKEGKEDRAKLRKLRDAIDTRRKEVKKQVLAPYEVFESRVKELTSLIDAPISAIDRQIKSFEEQKKEEKLILIAEAYDRIVPANLQIIIPLSAISDPKWLNATTKMQAVEEALTSIVKRTKTDMMVLSTVDPKYSAAASLAYKNTFDVEYALAHVKALKDAEETTEALGYRVDPTPTEEAKRPAVAIEEPAAPQEEETVYALRLELHVTKYQAKLLKRFLVENSIAHEKI